MTAEQIVFLSGAAHGQSAKSGFWSHDEGCVHAVRPQDDTSEFSRAKSAEREAASPCACANLDLDMKIVLIHSEISEALEEFRLGDEKRGGKLNEMLYACPYFLETYRRARDDRSHGAIANADCPRTFDDKPHKPEGFMSELADIAIRVFDLTGRLRIFEAVAASFEADRGGAATVDMETIASLMADAHACTVRAGTALRQLDRDRVARDDAADELGLVLRCAFDLAAKVGGDLDEAIRIKMAFNATRAFRHGGKVC